MLPARSDLPPTSTHVTHSHHRTQHKNGGTVLYWMRMKDLRLRDNKALSLASETAQKYGKNLVILHVISPGDFKAHDRAPVRIDFVLRNLALLQVSLGLLHLRVSYFITDI